jgi:hypothetical protein
MPESFVRRLSDSVHTGIEQNVIRQLNDFIKRDLIVLQMGPMTMVRCENTDEIEVRQSVELLLKDREYIEKLEAEIETLKSWKERVERLLNHKLEEFEGVKE